MPTLAVGGTEKNLLDLVARLDRQRFAPAVWCSERLGPIAPLIEAGGVPVCHHELSVATGERVTATTDFLRNLRPHIFHSMSYRHDCSDVLAAVFADVPVIVTCRHNMRHWDPQRTVQEWEQIRNRVADAVVANCAAVAADCTAVEHIPQSKVRVIRNGVDLPSTPHTRAEVRSELGLRPDAVLVGNVGNLRAQKAHENLLRAWPTVVRAFPAAHLVICGADYGLGAQLHALASSLGISERVSFLGPCERMDRIYAALDVYVQSSRVEGLSTALLEAMGHGCAVVATDAGGTREAVLDGVTGLLIPVDDVRALAKAVKRLLGSPALARTLGDAARQLVSTQFTVERVVEEHRRLYEELLEVHGVS